MPSRIQPISLESENALEQLLLADLGNLEEGLQVLDNQVPAGTGFIDILATDSEKALVVIELKKEESDRMLLQTLEYYDFVRERAAHFASTYRHKYPIDEHAEPRLILVAHTFSETLQAAAKYLDAPLALYTYEYLHFGNENALYLTELPVSEPKDFQKRRRTPVEHLDKIKNPDVRALCESTIQKILAVDSANMTTKGLRGRIAIKYQGHNLAYIWPRQNWFLFKMRDHPRVRISNASDLNDEVYEEIKSAMRKMASGEVEDEHENEAGEENE
jgi:Holliday junction resolvase-like predicted endonuclease